MAYKFATFAAEFKARELNTLMTIMTSGFTPGCLPRIRNKLHRFELAHYSRCKWARLKRFFLDQSACDLAEASKPLKKSKRVSVSTALAGYQLTGSASESSSSKCLVSHTSSFRIPAPKVQAASPGIWKPFVANTLGSRHQHYGRLVRGLPTRIG